ncbi:hypothetical protein [Methanocalculus chunghsingensis]|uniref:hypothetical protein n=1 Tax=Methanocalculus chunghsingensis TaxID=156457 RepID=UPI001B8C0F6B|nr:hypothetical protein [Methanocalculus chunghsingensis]
MLRTFRARIRNNYIEWDNDTESQIPTDEQIPVFITILSDQERADQSTTLIDTKKSFKKNDAERGKKMGDALKQLAKMNVFGEIHDPIRWQREQRRDRKLPGRYDAD